MAAVVIVDNRVDIDGLLVAYPPCDARYNQVWTMTGRREMCPLSNCTGMLCSVELQPTP